MLRLENGYKRLLFWSLYHTKSILLVSVAILIISVITVLSLGVVFLPNTDQAEFYVYMEFPEGYTLERSHQKVQEIDALIRSIVPECTDALFVTGFASETSRSISYGNKAYAKIFLSGVAQRERGILEIMSNVQETVTREIPDVELVLENGGFSTLLGLVTGGSGYQIELSGSDFTQLYTEALRVKDFLEADPEVYKALLDVQFNQQQIVTDLALDQMGRLGVTPYEAGLTARILFQGMEVGTYRGGKESMDILLTSDLSEETISESLLERIRLVSKAGTQISFLNFSSMRLETLVSELHRKDRMNQIVVTGYMNGEDISGITERMRSGLPALELPAGITWQIGGSASLFYDSFSRLLVVLTISLFLVYSVMVIQFERFVQPLIVMVSVPFCLIGVVLGLLLFGSNMSLVAFLGVIALGGIVVNNAIVLIDRIDWERAQQKKVKGDSGDAEEAASTMLKASPMLQASMMPKASTMLPASLMPKASTMLPDPHMTRLEEIRNLQQALLHGAASRVRPILMTTLTTFFGVLPMALTKGGGSEMYAPLGQAISGGLITSTLITLILIPLLYYLVERHRLERSWAAKRTG